jgi:hypothetical protein
MGNLFKLKKGKCYDCDKAKVLYHLTQHEFDVLKSKGDNMTEFINIAIDKMHAKYDNKKHSYLLSILPHNNEKNVSFSLSLYTIKKIKELSERTGMSINSVVRNSIYFYEITKK